MTDNWKTGDLAVCVNSQSGNANGGAVKGVIYEVLSVSRPTTWHDGIASVGLSIDVPDNGLLRGGIPLYYHPKCFRKVQPDTTACDREEWRLIMDVNKARVNG